MGLSSHRGAYAACVPLIATVSGSGSGSMLCVLARAGREHPIVGLIRGLGGRGTEQTRFHYLRFHGADETAWRRSQLLQSDSSTEIRAVAITAAQRQSMRS